MCIGKRIMPGLAADDSGEKMREIIGVVGNVKHLSLRNEDSPEMYLPRTQIPFSIMWLVGADERFESGHTHKCGAPGTNRARQQHPAHWHSRLRRICLAFARAAALQRRS